MEPDIKKQNTSRRKFLKQSGTVLTGLALSSPTDVLSVGTTTSQVPRFLFEPVQSDDIALAQAKAAIPKIRMRDAEIQVLNRMGQPMRNQAVEIIQQKHHFSFGDNNVGMDKMFRSGQIGSDRSLYYRMRFKEVLNALNATCYWTERPRNDMAKVEEFQGDLRLESFEESVNWALSQGLTVKGHPLYWGTTKAIPEWLLKYPIETQMKFVEVRIRNLTSRYKGRVKVWDIVNEAIWEPALKNLAKRDWPHLETMDNLVENIVPLLRWAREEDPDAIYLLNDYGVEADSDENLRAADGTHVNYKLQRLRYLELVGRLDKAGVPPGGIGLQCHIGGWQYPKQQRAFYDEMSASSFPLHVTEFWAHTDHLTSSGDSRATGSRVTSEEWRSVNGSKNRRMYTSAQIDEMQAEYVANYLTTAFGHPGIDSFFFWGFMGMAVKWHDPGSSSHELTPVFHKVKDLIHNQWHTRKNLVTDSEGRVQFSGFFGDFSLKILTSGQSPGIGLNFALSRNQAGPIVLQSVSM